MPAQTMVVQKPAFPTAFIAAAMTHMDFDKRIALQAVSRIGANAQHVFIGTNIEVGIILGFLVPSATAFASAVLSIVISVLVDLPGKFNRLGLGMTMPFGFVMNHGFILPVNSPQIWSVWSAWEPMPSIPANRQSRDSDYHGRLAMCLNAGPCWPSSPLTGAGRDEYKVVFVS